MNSAFARFLSKLTLILFGSFSSYLAIFGFIGLFDPENDNITGSTGVLIIFTPLALYLGHLFLKICKHEDKKDFVLTLEYLKKEKKITPAEIALEIGIPVSKTKKILEDMCDMGLTDKHITDQGNILYSVNMLSQEEKSLSKKPKV